MFGYKNHIGIDKAHGLIRTWRASAANAHDGARLPDLVSRRTIGIARATIKIGMANLAYNFQRLAWLEGRIAPA